jgi:TolA-binding protein
LSALDQHALLAALELHPEAGGQAAGRFLTELLETLDPTDLWQMVRLARCFVKRGNEKPALSLYRWCAAGTSYSNYISFSNTSVTANMLVDEIRSNLAGPPRIRALEAVLPLITHDGRSSSSEGSLFQFILTIWAKELGPREIYQRCPEICRQVVQGDLATPSSNSPALELATLILAAGGNTEEALNGLPLLLKPPTEARRSEPSATRPYDYLLQQWLPEDMTDWTNADRWLSGIVERVGKWETAKEIATADAVRILSLVAVRQHQNNFKDDAQATLAGIGKLPLTNPKAAVWFSDAAEITGNRELALEVAATLLKERRLPIVRVAPLMAAVAELRGVPAALELGAETLEYTWEHGFLETMAKICTEAGDQEHAELWKERIQQILRPGTNPRTTPVVDQAKEAYQRLREASEAGRHAEALELGETFLAAYPDHPEIATALHLAAKAGRATSTYGRAIPLLRIVLKDHPDFAAIDEVRFELAECLSGTRALEECIAQCRENLETAPDSSGADYYRFLIPQSQFRLWRFKEAEEGLKDYLARYPGSDYAASARRHLDKINPSWEVDGNGLAAYSGKYEEDYRFKAALAALPGHIRQGREMIRERLGVDIDFKGKVNFIFRDAGPDSHGGLMAETFTICRDYQPVTVIQFFTEHVVIDPENYRTTVIHEMKHAGFKMLMGRAYDDVPDWITEGLAQWAADQGEARMDSALSSETFAGKDPADLANGVANPHHDLGDYLEDVLAFEWLEKHKPGSVREFAMGLVEGKNWRELLAGLTGLEADEALRRMDLHCKERIRAILGPAGRDALALRDTQIARGNQGAEVLRKWLREEGSRGYAEWLAKNPEHILSPMVRFYLGRGLILASEYAEGRKSLRDLIDSSEVTTLVDDALFWEGYAFQQEKRMTDAARTFGILLRDYSWSNSAAKIRGKFEPAGPELK